MEGVTISGGETMEQDSGGFWQLVEQTQEQAGPIAALTLVTVFAIAWAGSIFLAAWAISATIGTNFWMTALSVFLLKIVLD